MTAPLDHTHAQLAMRSACDVCPAEVTGDQMVATMEPVGVDGAILVSPFSLCTLWRG
jgi:hypothetical protein